MNRTKKIVATLALGALLVGIPVAHACTSAPEPRVHSWLGISSYDEPSSRPPSNLASVMPVDGGTRFFVGDLELFRVPEGTTEVDFFGTRVALDETPDETPPTTPEIQSIELIVTKREEGCGGGGGTCDTFAQLDFDVIVEDDRAPQASLSYAIWLSSEPSLPVGAPDHLVVTNRYSPSALWTYGDIATEGRDLWAVVQVLDQAGNASGFSEPFLVDTGKRGCTTSGVPTGTLVPLAFGLLLLARRRR
jgi:uncharacterized protein (TIGR03382 family)